MNKRKLYESIMRNVAKTVKRCLNESSSIVSKEVFMKVSWGAYRKWLDDSDRLVLRLKKEGVLYQGMDFNDAADIIEADLRNVLDNAVHGDWWDVGEQSGYTYDELESIWVDDMQAKTDCIADIEDED